MPLPQVRNHFSFFIEPIFHNVDIAVDVLAAQERAANVNPQSSFMTPFLGAEATNCQCGAPHSPKNANAKIYLFWKRQHLTLCL